MQSLVEKIQSIIPEQKNRHTYFQLKHFIICKEPTVQSRINACLRELENRKQSLEAIELQIADEFDNKLILEAKINKYSKKDDDISQIKVRKLGRAFKQLDKHIESLRIKMRGIEQESLFLIELYEELIKQEPPKDWDDFQVQAEYWNAKLTHELKICLTLSGNINNDLVSSIMALPNDLPVKQRLLTIYKTRTEPEKLILQKNEDKIENNG